jgi:hypothetical protein
MPDDRRYLDIIEIPEPCPASWEAMEGDQYKRFCSQCSKHVFDLSAHSREEAEQLLQSGAAKICVSFIRNPDGSVQTDECPRPLRPLRNGLKLAASFVAGIFVAACATVPGFAQGNGDSRRLGGKPVAMPPPPVPQERINGDLTPPPYRTSGEPGPVIQNRPLLRATVYAEDIQSGQGNLFVDSRSRTIRGLILSQSFQLKRHSKAPQQPLTESASAEWQRWYHNVGNSLFAAWKRLGKPTGQITVQVTARQHNRLEISRMGSPHPANAASAEDIDNFVDAVQQSVNSLSNSPVLSFPPVPAGVEEVSFSATFGVDHEKFPRHDAEGFDVTFKYDPHGNIDVLARKFVSLVDVSADTSISINASGGDISVGSINVSRPPQKK